MEGKRGREEVDGEKGKNHVCLREKESEGERRRSEMNLKREGEKQEGRG